MSINTAVQAAVSIKDLANTFKLNGIQALNATGEILGVAAGVVHIAANVIRTAADESDHNRVIDAKSLANLSNGLVVVDLVAEAVQEAHKAEIAKAGTDVVTLLALIPSIAESAKSVNKAFESLKA
jgi:hypothetical protein